MLTTGFAQLLNQADEDYIVQSILEGVPISTKLILGKKHLTPEDLISLPRLSDSKLSEHGAYIDIVCVEISPGVYEWRIYVGSATGQFGLLQRWNDYLVLKNKTSKIRHEQIIRKPGSVMNIRCVAHFGFSPEHWLIPLAESVFMLFLGSVYDPRITWGKPEYSGFFINDDLYKEIKDVRSDCDLEDLSEGRGLNQTWSLVQGWKGFGIKAGVECVNCKRVVLEVTDPGFKRTHWTNADSLRPSASETQVC